MFKKLKDKLAEEVKSSPQRIQQFAQAAQAAVTSASSSISDITNSDLFSIGDNDSQQSQSSVKTSPNEPKNTFQDVSLVQPGSQTNDSMEFASSHDPNENQRQRRLSNSSLASDVSFRLPSYESPSMYHLQSDMEVSASEAEERGFGGGAVSLDRVTKEQIYAAYRRTRDRYSKYRAQYADLARHYKLLERENAKARSVLVETQDKALRRISELREQCSLEQSAKAHLEKALRIEIEEKNMKIDTLNTKIKLLQENDQNVDAIENKDSNTATKENNVQLISFDNENNQMNDESVSTEIINLNTKIDKLEKLVNKYKDSFKTTKEKNAQLTTEIQVLSTELDAKKKYIEELNVNKQELDAAKTQIQELIELNEQLQNKINVFDFNKSKELSTLELDLQKSQEEITQLRGKVDVFSKREEEYAISLAENKLSIHKELEGKENEIKSLKDKLSASKQEIQSLNIVIANYKNKVSQLEDENAKHLNDFTELNSTKSKITELEAQLLALSQKCTALESSKAKSDEEYKCLQLQLKQETAEKLAMIDRNTYLEERNSQLSEENAKKTSQIRILENDVQNAKKERQDIAGEDSTEKQKLLEDVSIWKNKYSILEAEIQEEREELVKLQTEIEKLLANDELIQIQNTELNMQLNEIKSENATLFRKQTIWRNTKKACEKLIQQVKDLQKTIVAISQESKSLKDDNKDQISRVQRDISCLLQKLSRSEDLATLKAAYEEEKSLHYASRMELKQVSEDYQSVLSELDELNVENNNLKAEINNNELRRREIEGELQRLKDEFESMRKVRNVLEEKLQESNSKYVHLQNSLVQENSEQSVLKQDVANMIDKISCLEADNVSLNTQINKLNIDLVDNISQINNLKEENNSLLTKHKCYAKEKELSIQQLQENAIKLTQENVSLKLQSEIFAKLKAEQENIMNQISTLKEENDLLVNKQRNHAEEKQLVDDKLQKTIKELAQANILLKTQSDVIEKLKNEQEENRGHINKLKDKYNLLANKHDNYAEEKRSLIEKLQVNIKDLTQENISHKTQSEKIADSVKNLEIELREVRKSHAVIEVEKDHLNSVIEQLEKNERVNVTINKDTQTENKEAIETLEEARAFGDLSSTQYSDENTLSNVETYNLLINENDSLKEENKRLQSDVTGLQTYLAKISKENSELNDKLREVIASSENSAEKNDIDHNLSELKEKLDDFIRENTLLVEENLELKDQLSSQNYTVPTITTQQNQKSGDYLNLQEKYDEILDQNNILKNKMLELESMNKFVNGNMTQIHENNEKLKLTNEKLERRLDEALVSLRHLHSLQENTELEYLRNILYEYLTGTGAHSVTLAKVLAAVVKFDERQTQEVLLKEKERQGFLRQLGII